MHVQNFYFANINLLLFCRSRCRRRRRRRFLSFLSLSSKHLASIITWRHKARAPNKIPSVHPPPPGTQPTPTEN